MNISASERRAEYSLTVSEFAKLCVTTRDTLRYYYEQNILTPWVDPENGYHYYSASQISSFFFISTMRQSGCSIREIADIMHDFSPEGIVKLINRKILDMQRELYLLNKKISALHLGSWMMERYGMHKPGVPFEAELPELSVYKTPIRNHKHAYHTGDIAYFISSHLAKASAEDSLVTFPSGATIDRDDFFNGNYVYNSVISLSLLPADGTSNYPLPGTRAVLCSHAHDAPDIDRSYRRIASYIKKNRLKACSDLFSVSLINLYDNETNHKYYKYLFICVE